ncbi:hypothetical protein ACX40Y_07215 [Sphingomonas sp. RS6]
MTLRRLFRRNQSLPDPIGNERHEAVSPDLAYELQSKLLDQLATVSVAAAGLAITLIGSLLQESSRAVWITVVFFGLAAMTAIGGNVRLIDALAERKPVLHRCKRDVQLALGMIGAAAGFLSMGGLQQRPARRRARAGGARREGGRRTPRAGATGALTRPSGDGGFGVAPRRRSSPPARREPVGKGAVEQREQRAGGEDRDGGRTEQRGAIAGGRREREKAERRDEQRRHHPAPQPARRPARHPARRSEPQQREPGEEQRRDQRGRVDQRSVGLGGHSAAWAGSAFAASISAALASTSLTM